MDINWKSVVNRLLPIAAPDTTEREARLGRYGDQYVQPLFPTTKHAQASEGSYYVATNPTPDTAIAVFAALTAFADTTGFFGFKNTENANNQNAKRIYLDYLRLILRGTPPTAQVSQQFAIKRSKTIDREPTTAANRTLLTPVNVAGASGRNTIARVYSYSAAAAMTIPASLNSDEVMARCSLPTGIGIAGDEYIIKFGADPGESMQGLTAAKATVPGRYVTHAPPLIVEPGETIMIHRWSLTEATNGPSFEFEAGWTER